MSRSYKHTPIFQDKLWMGRSSGLNGKTYSNRKIRRKIKDVNIDVGNGKDYRRFGLDSWDIVEYKSYYSRQEAIADWEKHQKERANGVKSWRHWYDSSLEEDLIYWKKSYKCK